MAKYKPVEGLPEFQSSFWADVSGIEVGSLTVQVDDDEWLIAFTFSPYQGLRLTTEDCFLWPEDVLYERPLFEMVDSPWIEELKAGLKVNDSSATFMDEAHHFLIPARQNVIEVVAWNVKWEITSLRSTPPTISR